MPGPQLFIRAAGMACPIGLTADSACLAMRSGRSRKAELSYLDDEGRPIVGSRLALLDTLCRPENRWFQLLVFAIEDLARSCPEALSQTVPIICVTPSQAQAPPLAATDLASRLASALGLARPPSRVESVSAETSSGFGALARARAILARGEASVVLVCAADSLLNARRLLALSRTGRLLTEDNSDGVIPGEAAACVLLSMQPMGAVTQICGIGFGREPALLDNDAPLRAEGLVVAGRMALGEASLALHDMDARVSDAAGEGYGFREQALAVARQLRTNKERFPLFLPALTLGDTGCAAGLCGIVSSTSRVIPTGLSGPWHAIVYESGAVGERAAVILRRLAER